MNNEDKRLTADQQEIFDALCEGKNTFIAGAAGTGKSFLIKKFVEDRKKKGYNVVVTAFTGVAAINIGGATIHKTFGYKLGPILPSMFGDEKLFKYSIWKYVDVIIIDELSMVRIDLFELLCTHLSKAESMYKKKIQLVLLGDFFQLPPVITPEDKKILKIQYDIDKTHGFCFESKMFKNIIELYGILKTPIRQTDTEFIRQLELLKIGNESAYNWFNTHLKIDSNAAEKNETAIVLCSKRSEVADINNNKLRSLDSKEHIFNAELKTYIDEAIPSSYFPNEAEVHLKVGARVMLTVNDKDDMYQNGSLGIVMDISKDGVTVLLDTGVKVCVDYYTWNIIAYETDEKSKKVKEIVIATYSQIPLKLAWAVTIHKSQGQTYDSIVVKPEELFSEGQLYVALSRCKSLSGIILTSPLRYKKNMVYKNVLNFYGL